MIDPKLEEIFADIKLTEREERYLAWLSRMDTETVEQLAGTLVTGQLLQFRQHGGGKEGGNALYITGRGNVDTALRFCGSGLIGFPCVDQSI